MKDELTVSVLITAIRGDDENERTEAWLRAGELGPRPLKQLAQLMATGELEVRRAAGRAMWQITRTVAAPGAKGRRATVRALIGLLGDDQPVAVRREVLWMISELDDRNLAVAPVAALLTHAELREDSRMVLERLPGHAALDALQAGFDAAPEDFKHHMAQSLRKRGVEVAGYPCRKLTPTKGTQVTPVSG